MVFMTARTLGWVADTTADHANMVDPRIVW